MNNAKRAVQSVTIVMLLILQAACIVEEPHEGYYDHDHHRYYHEHAWHECGEHNDYCH